MSRQAYTTASSITFNSNNTSSYFTVFSGINCDTVNYVQRYSPIVLAQVLQLLLAFCSVALIVCGTIVQNHTYFHPNVKTLLKTYHVAILMYGVSMGTAQMYHALTSMSFESCELLISCRLCFGFRLISTATIIMFSLLLFAIPLERTIATQHLGRGYENRRSTIGQFLSWTTVTVSFMYSLVHHWSDFSTNRVCTHCVYDQSRDLVPTELVVSLAGLSTFSFLYTLFLWIFNKFKLRKKTYSLAIEFQIIQNRRILHLILPLSLLTSFAFLWNSLSPQVFDISESVDPEKKQFHKILQNIFPLYSLLSSAIWLLMMISEKKKKRIGMVPAEIRKDEEDVYFQSLNDQWSRVPSQKPSCRLQLLTVFSAPRSSMVA